MLLICITIDDEVNHFNWKDLWPPLLQKEAMKIIFVFIFYVLTSTVLFAQAVLNQAATAEQEQGKTQPLDTLLMAIGAVTVSAIVIYMVYFSMKRKGTLNKP
jgi:polyferredoxin